MANAAQSRSSAPSTSALSDWTPLVAAWLVLCVAFVCVQARLEPPPAQPRDAPASAFSAVRALDILAQLIADNTPHPVGSVAGERVATQLRDQFAALGLDAELQVDDACSRRSASCGRVRNVVARLPGPSGAPAILVSAHHDSVAAGPGAGDDGAGVSVLVEVARALTHGPALARPVIFLAVDGEEAGLLGAHAFIAQHRWAADIGHAVNLDAGGTRGVTSITRTSPDNAHLVAAFAAAVPRPYGASVIGAVYSLTPYDTDFSVYDHAEIPSIDLGFGEDKAHYHTALDNLENLDPASVQHLGDTALALVRRLALTPPPVASASPRVFLDALGFTLVTWPAPLTPVLATLPLGLLLLAARRKRSTANITRRQHILAALAWPALVAVPTLVGIGLAAALAWLQAAEVPSYANPWPARVCVWAAVLASSGAVAQWLRRQLGPQHLQRALWWPLAGLSFGLAWASPGASVGVLPAVLVAGIVLAICGHRTTLAAFGCLWLPALMWLQASARVEAIFGIGPAAVAVLALVATLLAPLWPVRSRSVVLGLVAIAGTAAVFVVTSPAYSPDRPRRLTLVHHHDADLGTARWLIDGKVPLPPSMANRPDGANFTSVPAFAWTPDDEPSWTAPAPALATPPPTLELVADAPVLRNAWGRSLHLHLHSPRGARTAALVIPDSAQVWWMSVHGQTLPAYPEHRRKWYRGVRFHPVVAIPPEGVRIELFVGQREPIEFVVFDVADQLPDPAAALVLARPAWAVPSHGGDRSVISRSVRW